ncbi:hypothetical protein THARTR1_05092 [Trichoderma harzianum]|uniref:Protein kinase domain-containing protein n=1 Tax=Trichoderma harzianum TaxID=5544 RepID=A0A2K0U9R7_TRIHA|nr:hypothetical protein THARTR1_05092 [Trichoderma harzianum]
MHKPAQLASSSRPPRTVILDIDSMEQIPSGQTAIKAAPGSNGTVGFHSPEHEMSEYDGRTDVWALGVSLFRAIFGTFPWSYGTEGNPWRKDRDVVEARKKFHARYDKAVGKVADHYPILGGESIQARYLLTFTNLFPIRATLRFLDCRLSVSRFRDTIAEEDPANECRVR